MIGDLEGLNETKVAALEERGQPYGLTASEVLAADQMGTTPERYAAMKVATDIVSYRKAQVTLAAHEQGRLDAERERAKREALEWHLRL